MAKKKSNSQTIYQIKITLKGSRPPIWRRFLVASDITLGRLHRFLQPLMGWWDGHLHQFRIGNTYYADLNPEEDLECFDDASDENKVRLNEVLKKEKQKLIYEYDFGDGWEHELVLEKILPAQEGMRHPVCLDGKRRCPPEDCGGIGGYENMLAGLKNPDHPEHDEWREWAPEGFDPEEFDLDEINASFRFPK